MNGAEWLARSLHASGQTHFFFVDAVLPVFLVIGASVVTRPPRRERIDQFFGKMKTPVGSTREEEAAAVEETRKHPHRFDHLKLWPRSSWDGKARSDGG